MRAILSDATRSQEQEYEIELIGTAVKNLRYFY